MSDAAGRHRDPLDGPDPLKSPDPLTSPGLLGDPDNAVSVTRHEERAVHTTEEHEIGRVRVKKHIETYPVEQVVPRDIEEVDTSERVAALDGDSGQVETLPDGSVSIPIFEEVLVVTKRLVVKERLIVRKFTVVDEYTLQTELRREQVTVETDGDIEVDDRRATP